MNDCHKARKSCSKSNTNKVKLYYTLKIKNVILKRPKNGGKGEKVICVPEMDQASEFF